jgi:hypothetical protein
MKMKLALSLLCCLNCWSVAAAAELAEGRTVFLLPMGHSLDQFIANRLTRMHVLQVVTDPAKAETIITDEVGAPLEDKLNELYPPPAPAKEAPKEKEKEKVETSPARGGLLTALGDPVNKTDKAGGMGAGGHSRGTIFLVDVKSRQVLWSVFEKPRNTSPHELDHTAGRVVKQLKEDLSPKTK